MLETNGNEGEPSKKRKYEGQPTQSVVFELFSAQPFWSAKEMRQASGCPEKEIRQVLSEIAEFHRSGEHKGMWQCARNSKSKKVDFYCWKHVTSL
jgi:TFIIF, beta subunit HTH domain